MINSFLSTGWGIKERVGRSGFFFLSFFPFFNDLDALTKLRGKQVLQKKS